jgi:LEA14-like dessication related protein
MRKCLFLLAVALGWSGCATFVPTDHASISLVNVRSFQTGVLETSFDLVLRVTNETNRALEFAGSAHRVYVNGDKVGRGVQRGRVVVPALGTTLIVVPIHVENLALLGQFGPRMPDHVDYRLESRLFTAAAENDGLGVLTEGRFDLTPYKRRMQSGAESLDLPN